MCTRVRDFVPARVVYEAVGLYEAVGHGLGVAGERSCAAEGVEVELASLGAAAFAAERAVGRRFVPIRHLRDARAVLSLEDGIADRIPDKTGLRHDYSSDSTRRKSAL